MESPDSVPSSIFPAGFRFPDNQGSGNKRKKTEAQIRAQMNRIQSGYKRRIARAASGAASGASTGSKVLNAAKAVTAAGSRFGGVPGFLAGTVLSAAAFPLIERLVYGSREDQMREQFELQKKLEMEQMGSAPEMMGAASPQESRMYDLMAEKDLSSKDLEFAMARNRVLGGLARPSGSRELEQLIAGEEARIRSAQAPRTLTPYEIMGILDG